MNAANPTPTTPLQQFLFSWATRLNNSFDPAPPPGTPTVGTPNVNTGVVTGSLGFPTGGALTFTATQPSQGSVVVDSISGTYTYTPTQAARQAATATTTDVFTATVHQGLSTNSVTVTVPVDPGTPVAATPTVGTPPAAPLFVGDYSTGDFSQWTSVQLKGFNSYGWRYVPPLVTYSAQVVNDPVKGKAARFEVRDGDTPPWGGGERSQVVAHGIAEAYEGDTRWYALSTRFDPTFPKTHGWGPGQIGYGLTDQWHGILDGSPPMCWAMEGDKFRLKVTRQGPGAIILNDFFIWETPIGTDWHDIKMEVHWSTDDSLGMIRLWYKGVRQTFQQGPAGTRADNNQTYYVRTLVPNSPPGREGVYFVQGYYRDVAPTSPTGIVYHAGFKVAVDEAGLSQ